MSANQPSGAIPGTGQVLIDRYRIESELGRGGMAVIYGAVDLRLDSRRVVVKIPHRELLGDAKLRQRFLAEVRDLARHQHPHIVTIVDYGEQAGVPFAVLQHLGGGDLAARLQAHGGPMSIREVLEWLEPIAGALDFIHSQGCLHRDVKPANILFDEFGHPYLTDFGIATALEMLDSEAPTLAPQDQLTTLGTFIGSPAYAPPEAIDRIFTPAYDQYSLATIVYLALSGKLPYAGKTAEAMLIAKSNSAPQPLPGDASREASPGRLGYAVMKALSKDPADRFESCRAFADALAAGTAAASVVRASPMREPRRARFVAGLALAAIVAGGVHYAWKHAPGAGRHEGGVVASPIATAGATLQLGSTTSEIADALALCHSHADHCDPAEFEGEILHDYAIAPIEMDRTEVTNAAFARFVEATGLVTLAERRGHSWDGPTRRTGLSWRTPADGIEAARHPHHPVVHISFEEAQKYCEHHGRRLPSADEWEYQARGLERRIFPWGDDWRPTRLRFGDAPGVGLEAVGSHPDGATPEGVQDLAGSVWEWTTSVDDGEQVIKGASWDDRNPAYFRAAAFATTDAASTSSDVGFRCVRDGSS